MRHPSFKFIPLLLAWLIFLSPLSGLADDETLRIYTTTTTRDSGLMATLVPAFEKQSGIFVDSKAVGTGKAIKAGRHGKADLLWVHAPETEKKFIAGGYATTRIPTMYNDFILVGPIDDPANIKTAKTIVEALQSIQQQQQPFVSRGDDSGTHKKELALWKKAGLEPFGLWYYEAGAGMKKALLKANTRRAYTLVDRGTWLANKHLFKLTILHEGDMDLLNTYSLLPVNPIKFPNTNTIATQKFIDFVTKGEGRDIIAAHTINGERLFQITPVQQ